VDRLFSAFPSGRPGAGLFLLRFALVLTLVAGIAAPIGIRLVLALGGAMVFVGFLTPLVASAVAAASAGTAGWSVVTDGPLLLGTLQVHWLVAVVATALVMIGPGAYSVDARLFGWRELRMPDSGQD
jgi:uncharacterized membrane protein YphA (DoxX/SURF4 family)